MKRRYSHENKEGPQRSADIHASVLPVASAGIRNADIRQDTDRQNGHA